MKKNKTCLLTALLFLFSLFPFNAFAGEEKVHRFCTMDTAVDRLIEVARVPEELKGKQAVRIMAEDVISGKLADKPGERVKIEWKDVYDLRGAINAWMVQNGHPFNRIGQALDAVGSVLLGTFIGKVAVMNALMLAGPAGFIMLGGMNIVQETFQCNPSGVVMALNAGATVAVLVPWCKIPGVNKGCVALTNGIGRGVEKAVVSIFGKKVSATFVKETTNGVVVALRFKAKDKIMTAVDLINYFDGRGFGDSSLNGFGGPSGADALDSMKREVNWDGR